MRKQMPKGEARPLGTPKPKKTNRADTARAKIVKRAEQAAANVPMAGDVLLPSDDITVALPEGDPKVFDTSLDRSVGYWKELHEKSSDFSHDTFVEQIHNSLDAVSSNQVVSSQSAIPAATKGTNQMATLSLKGYSKNGKTALYSGLRTVTRLSATNFDGAAPSTIEVNADNFAAARVAESKAERKARLAALPKPTIAERAAKLEAKAAKLRASL